jgi:predicted nucleotidyltransferase
LRDNFFSDQKKFIELLSRYIRGGSIGKTDLLLSLLSVSFSFRKNAPNIINKYNKTYKQEKILNNEFKIITIDTYNGNNREVEQMIEYINKYLPGDLFGVYLHGSLATNEEIFYSDFDALVILKQEIFKRSEHLSRVAEHLFRAEEFMLAKDPLQHHGWFVMTENDLKNYPEYYFPHELFRYSKCLLGEKKFSIHLNENGYMTDLQKSFHKLCKSVVKKLESKTFFKNNYVFKNLLSEFMLLPAVYIQSKTGQGIFKKFSFEKLKEELGEHYRVMDEISQIRLSWRHEPSPYYLSLIRKKNVLCRKIAAKFFSGNVERELLEKFNNEMIRQLVVFVNELKSRLER